MTRTERLEMGFMAALGIGIGLMLSRAMQWPWWIAIPLCVCTAGASYHPRQWIGAVRDQLAPWATAEYGKNVRRASFVGISWLAYIAIGWMIVVMLCGAPIAGLMLVDGTKLWEKEPGSAIFLSVFTGSLLGLLLLLIGSTCGAMFRDIQRKPKRHKKPMWCLPLSRRLSRSLMPSRGWYLRGWHHSFSCRMACVTWKIPIALALGLYASAIFVLDAALTIGIAGATTRRLAVMTSAFAGAAVGTAMGALGSVDPGTGIIAGIGVGGCCGYFWHPVAMALKRTRWDRSPEPSMASAF